MTSLCELRAISPDGKRLAFVRNAKVAHWLMISQADGSGQRKIWSQKFPARIWDVEWSPDGKIIALIVGTHDASVSPFSSNSASSNTPDAAIELTSGSFIDDGHVSISWTPDGKI